MVGGFFLFLPLRTLAQSPESGFSKPFQFGELVSYNISYNWGLIWVDAGEVSFGVQKGQHLGKEVYHFVSEGSTYKKYDWFYKVRDRYEAYTDTSSLRPYRFIRDVEEGKSYYHNQYLFNHQNNKAFSFFKRLNEDLKKDTIEFPEGVYDVLSMIYFARCIPWEQYKIGDLVPIKLILDGEVYKSHIRYLGKEEKKVEELGKISCIKFQPRLIAGTIFPGGDDMTVWVSDDKNRIPVYIKTPIIVGNIKVRLKSTQGLKH